VHGIYFVYNTHVREKTILLSLIVVAFILAASVHGSPVQAQTPGASPDKQDFPETGHRVTGDFLTAYSSAKDPLKVYGYPITDMFKDQLLRDQPMIQFFEKAELRYYPLNPPELKVVQVRLGEILYNEGANQPFQSSSFLSFLSIFSNCQYFRGDNQYPVCNGFLDFFKANGGVAQFGYPISDAKPENGNGPLVQWFQNACMEWVPEKTFGQRVVLRNLGRIYYDEQGENPALLLPNSSIDTRVVISLQVHGFVNKAVMGGSGDQIVNVIVLDQSMRPVKDANVSLNVQLPSRKEAITLSGPTNEKGISSLSFSITDTSPGIAKITITAKYTSNDQPNGVELQQQAIISFLIWY
jgi:hypothetical protein